MLSIWHSGHLFPHPTWIALFLVFILSLVQCSSAQDFVNVSIPLNATEITYTPFACDPSSKANGLQTCPGGWQFSDSNPPTVSTFGPSPSSNGIIPQIFIPFRAFKLYLTTLPTSNATVNVTISSEGIVVSKVFNSSVGLVDIVNLPGNDTSLLTINFIASSAPTQFDLQSLAIAVLADSATSLFLPTPTLPPSISLPTFFTPTSASSSSTGTPTQTPGHHGPSKKMIAEAVGLTVGLGLGLTALAALAFYFCRRRQQQQRVNVPMQETQSGWNYRAPRYP